MSSSDPMHTPPEAPVPSALRSDESLPIGAIGTVAFVALVVFALSVVWAARLQFAVERRVAETVGIATPADRIPGYGEAEVGIVDQQLFAVERRNLELRRSQAERLHSYGWADRQQNTIRLPIEKAMEMYLSQRGAQPSPQPAPAEPEKTPMRELPGQPSQGGGAQQPQPRTPTK